MNIRATVFLLALLAATPDDGLAVGTVGRGAEPLRGGAAMTPAAVPANSRTTCSSGGGTRQAEPAIAVSGTTVIASYNDNRAQCPQEGYQHAGWAWSADDASSFQDGGPLPGGTRWAADQWLATGPDGDIYHSALSNESSRLGVMLARGTPASGGISWTQPIVHVPAQGSADKPAMAIDAATGTVYIAYTLFAGELNPASGLWLLRSSDRAQSFEGPFQVAHTPPSGGANAAFPVVGLNGELHLAWKVGRNTDPTNTVYFARSLDRGQTFSAPVVVAQDCPFGVPGTDGSPVFPQLAIDRSGGPDRGSLYLAWQTACPGGGSATLGDVVLSRSSDGGVSWSAPVLVNSDAGSAAHPQPTLAVDRFGRIWAFFYRVEAVGDSGLVDLLLSRSVDGGRHFDPVETLTDTPSYWGTIAEPGPRNYGEYITAISTDAAVFLAYTDARFGDPDVFVARMPVDLAVAAPPAGTPRLSLGPVKPTPGSGMVAVPFELERREEVTLTVYDPAGRRVATLARGVLDAGVHQAGWDTRGGEIPSGVYLLELRAGRRSITRKVILAR